MSEPLPPDIDILDRTQHQLDWGEAERLIAALFRERPDVRRVIVTPLPGSSAGMSTIALLLAVGVTDEGTQQNPIAVRIGPRGVIARERENHRRYITPYLGLDIAPMRLWAEGERLSALGYEYLDRSSEPLRTLRDFLAFESDASMAVSAIRTLFHQTIVRPARPRNGWCGDAQRHPEQQPLWFYNLVLPPTLTLARVAPAEELASADEIAAALAAADRPAAVGLRGSTLTLGPTAPFTLALADEEEEPTSDGLVALRCLLRVGSPPPDILARPLDPIAARLELRLTPAELPAVRAAIAAGESIRGRVVSTRYDMLHERVRAHDLHPHGTSAGLPAALGMVVIADPLGVYADLLSRAQPLHTCIVHGDMNLGNVLLRRQRQGSQQLATAWLIDFDRTLPGGHAVFDFVKLEMEYKIHLLPHRLRSAEDLLRLEAALHCALFNPGDVEELLRGDVELTQAYEFIASLRRMALFSLPGPRPSVGEYYLGLLAYGLAALKYRNLYPEGRGRWLRPEARIEPLARAAYLSAAFVASVIDQAPSLAAVDASFPPAHQRTAMQRPSLIGRDRLVASVERSLRERAPVALLHGPPGSGRGAVSHAVLVELEHAGYVPVTVEPEFLSAHESALDQFADELLGSLELAHVRDLPEPLATGDALRPARRRGQIVSLAQRLAAAIEGDQRRFALELTLRTDDRELELFVVSLARSLRRSVLLLIAERPIADLSATGLFAVEPLTVAELQAYARREQLTLSSEDLDKLHAMSHGLPLLLMQLLADVRNNASDSDLGAALRAIPVATTRDRFARALLEQLPDEVQRVAELDALLARYGLTSPADRVAIAQVALELEPAALQRALARYDGGAGRIAAVIAEAAFDSATSRGRLIRLARAAADYYARAADGAYLCARYAAVARDWRQAETMLELFLARPDRSYHQSREQLLGLVEELLASGHARQEARMHALAGACAAYLSSYDKAASHYSHALLILAPDDPLRARAAAQLLAAHQATGNVAEAAVAAEQLRAAAPDSSPLQALVAGQRGYEAMIQGRPDLAGQAFAQAVAQLDASRDQWGAEREPYEEQYVRLLDMLARTAIMQGRHGEAIRHLTAAHIVAQQQLGDLALAAMIQNDLGTAYGSRGQPGDSRLALDSFARALEKRRALRDWIGMLRSGQNLAIQTTELATRDTDWERAEAIYAELEGLVDQVQDFDATQIYANHLELLARRGDTARAGLYITRLADRKSASAYVSIRAQLNRARLALIEGRPAEAREALELLTPLLGDPDADREQQREWVVSCLELHLLHGQPYDAGRIQTALGEPPDMSQAPRDAARWLQASGLLACAQGKHASAGERLAQAEAIWLASGYLYLAAVGAFWQGFVGQRAGDVETARTALERALARLTPFGEETPRLKLARVWANHARGR